MRICYVLDANPETYNGGTPSVVKNLLRYTGGRIVSGSRNTLTNLILMLIVPFRVVRYSIINIHDTQGYFCTFWPMKKKTVYTCHGTWKNYYRIFPPKTIKEKIRSMTAICLQRRLITKSRKLIAVSENVKNQIVLEYGMDPKNITVIYNGVDTRLFTPGNHGSGFIWVGDNPELKGLNTAIKYAELKKKRIIVVGIDGKNSYNVEYAGKVLPKDMPKFYRLAKTLLFFSKMEGHPLVPLEAAACGLNIIASRESNIEIFPLKNGIYNVSGKYATKIVKKYDWSNQSNMYKEEFSKVCGV